MFLAWFVWLICYRFCIVDRSKETLFLIPAVENNSTTQKLNDRRTDEMTGARQQLPSGVADELEVDGRAPVNVHLAGRRAAVHHPAEHMNRRI